MKRQDWILFGGVIAFSLLMIFSMKLAEKNQGNHIVIRQNGEIYGTYSLNEEQMIEIKQGESYNRICIQEGKACMEEANCPDGYCIEQHGISGEKETIVCLPNKLIVEVGQLDESEQGTIDAIAK